MPVDFDLVDAVTAANPNNVKNEDAYFFLPGACLVLDGATGLAGPVVTGDSDGHWFVNRFQFHAQSAAGPGMDLAAVIATAVAAAGGDLEAETDTELPAYSMPSAGLIALDCRDGEAVLYRLGDCRAYIVRDGSVERPFGDSPLEALDRRSIAALRDAMATGLSRDEARQSILPMLREHRSLMNAEGGYGVLSVQPGCIGYLERQRCRLSRGDHVLLMTDGFAAAIDGYGAYTVEEAVETMRRQASSEIIRRLRDIEIADSDLATHPRLKQFDDATAVLLRRR